ncbi:hypothetical protein ACFL2H_01790 [Planctomycetota bacterium]
MSSFKISVVCCDESTAKFSRLAEAELTMEKIGELTLETVQQEGAANDEREMHNAAHHAEHGPVTYLQHVHDGGFAVMVGEPGKLQERFFGAGEYVAFMDDEGPGHASKVGPNGVKRTLRILKGHLELAAD